MPNIKNIVALDCGNSSVRVVLGRYYNQKVNLEVVHRVPNYEIEKDGVFYWDIHYIIKELSLGIKKAYEACGRIDSVGIATWGIDFVLLDQKGEFLSDPLCYRNPFGDRVLKSLSEFDKYKLFEKSQIQCDRINSIYQYLALRKKNEGLTNKAEKILLIPDLLIYYFTGQVGTDRSIASTTQFFNGTKNEFSKGILKRFYIDESLFSKVYPHGEVRGYLKDKLVKELGVNKFPFISVPSHDTASAVTAIPTNEEDFLFISSGTWSLIGTEIDAPIINKIVYEKGFTNESGIFNTTTFLKNSAGLYLVQRLKKDIDGPLSKEDWSVIVEAARKSPCETVINPNSPSLFNPPNMAEAILIEAKRTGQKIPKDDAALFKTAYLSLAFSYKRTILDIEAITGKVYYRIHIIGGGSKNDYLNQLTADLTGKKVVAGPYEATAMGAILSQLPYVHPNIDLKTMRKISRNSTNIAEFGGFWSEDNGKISIGSKEPL